MNLGDPEFVKYFIMNPITWVILILGFPPIMFFWQSKVRNLLDKKTKEADGQ